MPRNGSGQYNPLTNTWNPPVTGVLATGADFQAQLNDISAAITQSVSKDGQTPMTANLPMGNNSIVGIASGTETSPSISANGDTNTGLYFPAADTVGVAVGGVNVGNFTSAGFSGNAATATNATNLVNGNATLTAGTAAAPSLTTTGDTNTGLYFPAADTVAIATGGVKRVEVDTNGNVGVGVTPSAWAVAWRGIDVGSYSAIANASGNTRIYHNAYTGGSSDTYKNTGAAAFYGMSGGAHQWYTAPSGTAGNPITFTQAMTLDASGNLLVGTTNAGVGVATGFRVIGVASNADRAELGSTASTNANIGWSMYSTGAGAYQFYVGYGGTIYATSTTITGISDQRLKENIRDLDDGLEKVMALQPRKFDWKNGKGKGIANDRGFIAQEFEQVFPDMVEEWKDPAPEGEEPYKAVNANLIPTLVKAIQEQQALIDAQKTAIESLTARIAALEAK